MICRGLKRRYFRFRATKFYGGSATADTVGCNLDCWYCWNRHRNKNPEKYPLYSPEEVAIRLLAIARKNHLDYARISGGEPTLCPEHLFRVIDLVEIPFILETNGLLLDEPFVRRLSRYDHVFVRISLKGTDPESFARTTNSSPHGFQLQLRALELLTEYSVPSRPAIINLFPKEDISRLQRRLWEINPSYTLEIEPYVPYGEIHGEKKLYRE